MQINPICTHLWIKQIGYPCVSLSSRGAYIGLSAFGGVTMSALRAFYCLIKFPLIDFQKNFLVSYAG